MDEMEGQVVESGSSLARQPGTVLTEIRPMDAGVSASRLAAVRAFVDSQLKSGQDYGSVPGVNKPFLWKSGAEKLLLLHQCAPTMVMVEDHSDRDGRFPYWEYTYRCDVIYMPTGQKVASADGTCSSKEQKYWDAFGGTVCAEHGSALRRAKHGNAVGKMVCPDCGWELPNATKQSAPGPKGDPWVLANTVRKMAQKRALVAASLHIGALSDVFTQDEEAVPAAPAAARPPQQQQRSSTTAPQTRPAWGQGRALKVPRWPKLGEDGGKLIHEASNDALETIIVGLDNDTSFSDQKWGPYNKKLVDAAKAELASRDDSGGSQDSGGGDGDGDSGFGDDDIPF